MRLGKTRFAVDREQGKLLGVCAGLSNHLGVDATIIRVALVLVTLMGAWPWSAIAYGIAWFAGRPRSATPIGRVATREESRERMRALDLRMQAIEASVASTNSQLAREIEQLR